MIRACARIQEDRETEEKRLGQRVERAQYEVRLAQRQYNAVDPENRLVARELERRYEKALNGLEATEAEVGRQRQELAPPLSEAERARPMGRAHDMEGVWRAPGTRAQDRKRIARCLLKAVTVYAPPGSKTLKAEVHWHGGEQSRIEVPRGRTGLERHTTTPEPVALVRQLASEFSDDRIARILSRKRLMTPKGKSFKAYHVANIRRKHGIRPTPVIGRQEKDVYSEAAPQTNRGRHGSGIDTGRPGSGIRRVDGCSDR